MAEKCGGELALMLNELAKSQATTALSCWQVRMHNMSFFSEQLPHLAKKFVDFVRKNSCARDPRGAEIRKVLVEAAGGKARRRDAEGPIEKSFNVEDDPETQRIQDVLDDVIRQCKDLVILNGKQVCEYVAMRIIYVDMGPDIFEDLYSPEFSFQTLEAIVNALRQTVDRFIEEAPDELRHSLWTSLVVNLAKAWVLLVTEMGYNGKVFTDSDMRVLDEDLEALRDYSAQHDVADVVDVGDGKSIKFLDAINDFFVLIGTKPHLLATLGGNYKEDGKKTEKEKKKEAAPQPAVGDMFSRTAGSPPPEPSPRDPVEKKKKGGIQKLWKVARGKDKKRGKDDLPVVDDGPFGF
eukprot:Polyplicarium_translucidae@DN2675_c0_g1_i2.p2